MYSAANIGNNTKISPNPRQKSNETDFVMKVALAALSISAASFFMAPWPITFVVVVISCTITALMALALLADTPKPRTRDRSPLNITLKEYEKTKRSLEEQNKRIAAEAIVEISKSEDELKQLPQVMREYYKKMEYDDLLIKSVYKEYLDYLGKQVSIIKMRERSLASGHGRDRQNLESKVKKELKAEYDAACAFKEERDKLKSKLKESATRKKEAIQKLKEKKTSYENASKWFTAQKKLYQTEADTLIGVFEGIHRTREESLRKHFIEEQVHSMETEFFTIFMDSGK